MQSPLLARCRTGLLMLLLALPGVQPLWADSDTEIENKESELQALRQRIASLQTDLGSIEAQRSALHEELKSTEQEIGQSARRIRVLDGSLQRQRQRLDELEQQRQAEQANLSHHQRMLADQVRAAYAMGRQERIKILLNQQDPAVVSRVMVYYDYFNRARAERMDEIARILDSLEQTEKSIAAEEGRLLELQAREQSERDRLEQGRLLRQEVIAALNSDISDKGEQLRGLEQDEQQLQGLVQRLQEALVNLPTEADRKPFTSKRGVLPWPTSGRLSASYGSAKAGNLRWDGVLIAAPEGQEVKSIDHGRVAFADWLRGFGLMIIIDHGDGYMSLYGHNQSLFKETGEWVEAGEPVALVGSSGGQVNAGVYFGIRYNGQPVNPVKWCRAAKRNRVGLIMRGSRELATRQVDPQAKEKRV